MSPERFSTIQRVLRQRQPDLTVITDEVHKGRNLSALMRNCDAVGINRMHCVLPRQGFRAYRGTDLGTHKWVEAITWESVDAPVRALQAQGMQVVVAHLSATAIDYREVDYTRPTALLLGAEKEGVSAAALELVDQPIVIPMMGMVESYNVAAACAIILAEAQRQRAAAGMYQQCRLTGEAFAEQLFRWCQPAVARFCDERQLCYPALDAEGDIAGAAIWHSQVKAGTAPRRRIGDE